MDFERLFGQLPSAYLVLTPDLVVVEVNASYLRLAGRTREELLDRPVAEVLPHAGGALDAHGRSPLQASLEAVRDSGRTEVLQLLRYDLPDPAGGAVEERFWSLVHAAIPGEDGTTQLLLQRVEDVTDDVREGGDAAGARTWPQLLAAQESAREAVAALRASERQTRALLDTAVDAIITIDGTGRIESVNRAAEQMFGYPSDEVVGENVRMLMPEPHRGRHDDYLDHYHRTGERRIIGSDREVTGRRRDGTVLPIQLAVSEVGSDPPLFMGVIRDITDRQRLEAQLVHQSLHDPLTGLANRSLLMERLTLASTRLGRHPGLLALFFIDLDRFKLVNDTLGHDAGDGLLVQTAARLRGVIRPEDLVARFGGDEFVVLCEDFADHAEAEGMAGRLVEALNRPLTVRGREIHASASVGLVTDDGRRPVEDLLGDADAAMYLAKQQGRGRYSTLDADARATTFDRLQLSGELHHALDRTELKARFQPMVDLGTGAVVATEALLRWEHPSRGELSPVAFLDLAADIGLVADFDAWMLTTACTEAVDWARRLDRNLGVWVNLSSRSLADGRLRETVVEALTTSGLDPRLLTLEITEGELMQDAPATVRTLTALRDIGVRLAVDDFGTGYSSLAYLQQFPVQALKVDRSFVARLDQETRAAEDSAAIVRAIVSLAAGLNLRTVAEGIETPGQLAAATALGCDLGQGYYLGRPASSDRIPTAARRGVVLVPGQRRGHLHDLAGDALPALDGLL